MRSRCVFFSKYILPHLVHVATRQQQLAPYRQRAVLGSEGRVLEIGVGSGINLSLYSDKVDCVIGIDPSAELLQVVADAACGVSSHVELVEGMAKTIPKVDNCTDGAVVTWSLCRVTDKIRVLGEVRRVPKPTGCLHFAEHGPAPEDNVRRWQDRITPIWRRCAGNCHLNRPVTLLIEECGFRMERLDTGYATGPRPMTFMYEGVARPK